MTATAVIPVRSGLLPVGAAETAAEAGGDCWLVGSGCDQAAGAITGPVTRIHRMELGPFDAVGWAEAVATVLPCDRHVLLPHSPDGRDLAPRLAALLDVPLVSAATELTADRAVVSRLGGHTMETMELLSPVVATVQIGARQAPVAPADHPSPAIVDVAAPAPGERPGDHGGGQGGTVEVVAELPADPATMDLSEAPRIIGAGAGLGDRSRIELIEQLAARLGASVGGTRVVTDWGWLPVERQIGTTGVMVDPDLYLAVAISGAVQHTAGLGTPDHVVSVNTDPSCPMMDLADLAIVCDGPAFLTELLDLLSP